MKRVFSTCCICVLMAGCSLMQSQGLVKQPEVTFVDAVPHSFSFTGCKVDVKLQAKNPNSFNINLDKMDVLLYINEQKTASTAFNNISLKAMDTSPLNTTVAIPFSTAGMALVSALQSKSAVKYKIDGVAHYKTPLGVLKFPVTLHKN